MKEQAVLIGKFKHLIGVVSEPEPVPDKSTGQATNGRQSKEAVVLLNAGLIHRIGPNRVYVKLARSLAKQGYLTLRMDLSGIGDSQPRPDHMPVEEFTIDDPVQAMDYLAATYGSQRFWLMGHCAGAYHSFRTAAQDPRVVGVVMMNPDGGETDWVEYDRRRKVSRYYKNYYGKEALTDSVKWKRFLTGRVSYRSVIKNLVQNVLWNKAMAITFKTRQRFVTRQPTPADQALFTVESILRKLEEVDTRLLLVYSEGSTALERAQDLIRRTPKKLRQEGKLKLQVISQADHTFTLLKSQQRLIDAISGWLN